jgi:hypothetical protein
MTKRLHRCAVAAAAAMLLVSTSATAGEVKGPPGSDQNTPGRISNGHSWCSFSGLNDTPEGIPGEDPGGIAQSYGYFMAQFGLFDPSDPEQRGSFDFPGFGCNPTRGGTVPDGL